MGNFSGEAEGEKMNEIQFIVRGVPVPQGSTRAFVVGKRAITTNKTPALVAWRHAIATEARLHAPPSLWEGALNVTCSFQFEPLKSRKKQGMTHFQRPDIDKLLRAVLDACTGVIWKDDAQVQILRGQKVYQSPPLCSIWIRRCVHED